MAAIGPCREGTNELSRALTLRDPRLSLAAGSLYHLPEKIGGTANAC